MVVKKYTIYSSSSQITLSKSTGYLQPYLLAIFIQELTECIRRYSNKTCNKRDLCTPGQRSIIYYHNALPLMHLHRRSLLISHHTFARISNYINPVATLLLSMSVRRDDKEHIYFIYFLFWFEMRTFAFSRYCDQICRSSQ